ncbi:MULTISPECIES: hypothetical protein [Cytobacillus]|uniref:hypothetical protein n=1 Tax=Cytobacillus TaxID=2675230 RepID=UPI00203DD559|nr:hypothetical protein [Cytobacillus firmus]MCM3708764.1 hypothetical protein [Cytobacillus firmus]
MSFFKKSILFLMTSILVFSSFYFDTTANAADNQFAKFEEQIEKRFQRGIYLLNQKKIHLNSLKKIFPII